MANYLPYIVYNKIVDSIIADSVNLYLIKYHVKPMKERSTFS